MGSHRVFNYYSDRQAPFPRDTRLVPLNRPAPPILRMVCNERAHAEPAMILSLREHTLEIDGGSPLIMGIVNIGADSVADGNLLTTLPEQLRFALAQVQAGAQIIDIGVQSGRTDTPEMSPLSELEALRPLVAELSRRGVLVSVDTWRASVAEGAVEAGAHLINDVSGLADPAMARVAADTGAGLVIMHTRAQPKREHFPDYGDVVSDVFEFLKDGLERAVGDGVAVQQLVLDPGPDFAKTPRQSVEVLRALSRLSDLERPILLAVSRKYFIGMLSGAPPKDRLAGTLAAIEYGLSQGASVLRVHDVAAVVEFLAVRAALRGEDQPVFTGDSDDERLKWIAPKTASVPEK